MVSPSGPIGLNPTELEALSVLVSGFPTPEERTSEAARSVLEATAGNTTPTQQPQLPVVTPQKPGATTIRIAPRLKDIASTIHQPPDDSAAGRMVGVSGRGDVEGAPAPKRVCASAPINVRSYFAPLPTPPATATPEQPKCNGQHYPILSTELWRVDSARGIATCRICDRPFLNKNSITENHQNKHVLDSGPTHTFAFICGHFSNGIHCDARFPSKEQRYNHLNEAHPEHRLSRKSRPRCPVPHCRVFTSLFGLGEHVFIKHQGGRLRCEADACGIEFSNFKQVAIHLKLKHGVPYAERTAGYLRECFIDEETGLLKTPIPDN